MSSWLIGCPGIISILAPLGQWSTGPLLSGDLGRPDTDHFPPSLYHVLKKERGFAFEPRPWPIYRGSDSSILVERTIVKRPYHMSKAAQGHGIANGVMLGRSTLYYQLQSPTGDIRARERHLEIEIPWEDVP